MEKHCPAVQVHCNERTAKTGRRHETQQRSPAVLWLASRVDLPSAAHLYSLMAYGLFSADWDCARTGVDTQLHVYPFSVGSTPSPTAILSPSPFYLQPCVVEILTRGPSKSILNESFFICQSAGEVPTNSMHHSTRPSGALPGQSLQLTYIQLYKDKLYLHDLA